MKYILPIFILILIPAGFALEGYENPRSGFSADTQVSVVDTAVYNTGYLSADGTDWQPFSLSGTTRGNWIVGEATSTADLSGVRYVAIFSCSWNSGWNCGSTWQVRDRGDPSLQSYLVQNGVPQADIVVASDAPSMVQLAAEYLQNDIQEMSGALLPIRNAPGNDFDFHVYVGESQYTQQLGIDASGTRDGGFKIISGTDYLVMLGDDQDYDSSQQITLEEWDALSSPDYFKLNMPKRSYNSLYDIHQYDKKGTINAVHEFLYDQGMRWYQIGEHGTVTPQKDTIEYQSYNLLKNPDFSIRHLYIYYKVYGHIRDGIYSGDSIEAPPEDQMKWILTLRSNDMNQFVQGNFPHGLNAVTEREETRQAHPEYYAIWGGERTHDKQDLCSEELLQATIRYTKLMYDTFNATYVPIWPADGFTRASESSPECKALEDPQRGSTGIISNYVWDFVNEVAWAIHDDPNYGPEKMILGGAYTAYQLPPTELSDSRGMAPNIAVTITRWRTWSSEEEDQQYYQNLIQDWAEILPSKQILTYDYYLHNRLDRPTESTPIFYPRLIDEDLKFLQDKSMGEFIEIYANWPGWDLQHDTFAAEVHNTYVTSRLYWDVNQDIDALLEEYYELYFGPASETMKEFYEYSENNINNRMHPSYKDTMRKLAEEALTQVPSGSVYETRINRLLGLINYKYEGEEAVVSECRDLSSQSTTYTLNQDVSSEGTCFRITASNVTLDCQEHTITYSTGGGSSDYGIELDERSFTHGDYYHIRNCNIQDGSYLSGETTGPAIRKAGPDNGIIENLNINTSGTGIQVFGSENNTYRNIIIDAYNAAFRSQYGNKAGTTLVSNNLFENNVFRAVNGQGAYLYRTNSEIIRNNEIRSKNDNGLYLFAAINATVQDNTLVSDSARGFYTYQTIEVNQEGNTIING